MDAFSSLARLIAELYARIEALEFELEKERRERLEEVPGGPVDEEIAAQRAEMDEARAAADEAAAEAEAKQQ